MSSAAERRASVYTSHGHFWRVITFRVFQLQKTNGQLRSAEVSPFVLLFARIKFKDYQMTYDFIKRKGNIN